MCNDYDFNPSGYDDDNIDEVLEEDARLGKTRENVLEEEIEALCNLGRDHGLMDEDIMRVLTKILNREADKNRGKFRLF